MASQGSVLCALVWDPANLGEGGGAGEAVVVGTGNGAFTAQPASPPSGVSRVLARLNFPWPLALWPAGPSERMASIEQLLRRSQLTPHKPCPGPVFPPIVRVAVALVGPQTREGSDPRIE